MASMTNSLRRQLLPTIEMLEDVIEQCPDALWVEDGGSDTVWQHVYHAAFWLNAWARDWSTPFEKPAFHSVEALELEKDASPIITRDEMREYVSRVKSDCVSFLDGLSDESLMTEQESWNRMWTATDRILAQIRHVQHHVGMLHIRFKDSTGQSPKWKAYNE